MKGGYIFYDCDEDNEIGNADGLISTECGWRYLEVAPNKTISERCCFGLYKNSSEGKSYYVNGSIFYSEGSSDPNDGKCTGKAIGTGCANTEKLITAMGDSAYILDSFSENDPYGASPLYAANVCANFELNGFSDWFLPSIGELQALMSFLQLHTITNLISATESAWSSSEDENNKDNAYYMPLQAKVYSISKAPTYWDQSYVIPVRYVSE